jgi:ferrous iron transport protein B
LQNEPAKLKGAIAHLVTQIETLYPEMPNARWVALRLLDGDERIIEAIRKGELGDLTRGETEESAGNLELRMETA